jgi:hypothetical protein
MTTADAGQSERPLAMVPLIDLFARIGHHGDRAALDELHQYRPVFRYGDGKPLRFAEYLDRLRQGRTARAWSRNVALGAYDLTLDKFFNLPDTSRPRKRGDGPDARLYFRALHKHVLRRIRDRNVDGQLDRERLAAHCFQGFVWRHFHLSLLDCVGRNPLTRRFTWMVKGYELILRVPRHMSKEACCRWLAANAADVQPGRDGEKARLQALVDQRLGVPRICSLVAALVAGEAALAVDLPLPWSVAQDVDVKGLAQAVADEKARALACQRPSIRRLAPPTLRRLVRTVFAALANDEYQERAVAAAFGLKRPTVSRFAGRDWANEPGRAIPDLWLNTATVLAAHAVFVEAAKDAGVWDSVERVLHRGSGGRSSEDVE